MIFCSDVSLKVMKNIFQYDTSCFYLTNGLCPSTIGSETLGFRTNWVVCFQHPFREHVLKFLTWLFWKET